MKNLKCKKCGRVLIRLRDDTSIILASGAVTENIRGPVPQAGDLFKLKCKCGFHIIAATPDYLIEELVSE